VEFNTVLLGGSHLNQLLYEITDEPRFVRCVSGPPHLLNAGTWIDLQLELASSYGCKWSISSGGEPTPSLVLRLVIRSGTATTRTSTPLPRTVAGPDRGHFSWQRTTRLSRQAARLPRTPLPLCV